MASPAQPKDPNSVKCVAIGDAAVGKTCLLLVYTTDKFPTEYVPTDTVFDNYETQLDVNGESFTFALWDTAGAEHYDVLRPLSYTGTDVFLVVYSVIDRESFDNVESKWVKDIKEKGEKDVPFIIVGNKVDIREQGGATDCVSQAEGKKLKNATNAAKFFEVSALLQQGLKETFDGAIYLAYERLKARKSGKKGKAVAAGNKAQSGGCCVLF
eukprot:maker-scaffold_1-snap-gene-24.17-mRNA-1 protein AED:0.24 eAED:0.24 QI:219/1/1/1/1/1/3/74/211